MDFATILWDQPVLSDEAIDNMRNNGIIAIETDPGFMLDTDHTTVRDTAARLKRAGITIQSCHAPFGSQNDLSTLDRESHRFTIEQHRLALSRAAEAGVPTMVIHPSSRIPATERKNRRAALINSIEELIPAAEHYGIRLALENMLPRHLCDSSTELLEIVEQIDSPALGVCFDTGHAHVNKEDVLEAFERLAERIIHFHLQDNDSNGDQHLQPPYGTIPWEELMVRLNQRTYTFPALVETYPWNNSSWKQLMKEMSALSRGELLHISLNGSHVRVICPVCGHYCFGTPENWSCACE